jgi:hypothetical protein
MLLLYAQTLQPLLMERIRNQLAFAEGSFDTSRNDTVSPSSW